MSNLAFSLVSCGALLLCAHYAYPSRSLVGAVRWASCTALLVVLLHLLWCVWERYRRHMTRGREEYSGVELDSGGLERGVEVQAQVVLYPELTISSVWVYVYGVGLLLFVSLYCLSGIEVVSTCWWVIGMTPLAIDELVSGGMDRVWVVILMLLAYASTTLVWFSERGAYEDLSSYEPWRLLVGIVCPVLSPFIFFSLRSTAQSATLRDVSRLCGLALPFMVVLALSFLKWTEGEPARRGLSDWRPSRLNLTFPAETHAKFYATAVQGDPPQYYLGTLCLLLSPFAAAAVLWQLVASVLGGFTSEFITPLLLLLGVRHWLLTGEGSFVGIAASGLAFVLILCVRRV